MYYDLNESGKRIAELRKQRGLTQEQLANELNIGANHLSKIERGLKGLSMDLMIEIAVFFKVSFEYIVIGQELCMDDPKEQVDFLITQLMELKKKL